MSAAEHTALVQQQQVKQLQLIGQLRDQLEELETFAYEVEMETNEDYLIRMTVDR